MFSKNLHCDLSAYLRTQSHQGEKHGRPAFYNTAAAFSIAPDLSWLVFLWLASLCFLSSDVAASGELARAFSVCCRCMDGGKRGGRCYCYDPEMGASSRASGDKATQGQSVCALTAREMAQNVLS